MGLFFYTKIGSIISIGDLPTTNIIEPFFIITNGKGENGSRLTLYSIHNGRAIEGTRVLTGDVIGETPDNTGLKVSYQKYKNKKEKLVYVNLQFYFPKVIQLQTTILPAISQFGGDEFE